MSTLNKGLVAHYTFDDADTSGSTLYDKSAYDNHGTLQNAPDTGKNGIVGEAYKFQKVNDEYVEVLGDGSVYEDWTISVWMNPVDWEVEEQGTRQEAVGVDEDVSGNKPLDIGVIGDTAGILEHFRGEEAASVLSFDVTGFEGWHHVVVTQKRIGSTTVDLEMFVDGVSVDTNSGDYENLLFDNFHLGGPDDSVFNFNGHLNGQIDDTRLYDRTLSDSEINRLYQQRSPNELKAQSGSGSAGIVAHWPLDDSGSVAKDKIGNNDGTLQGGVTTGAKSPTGRGMEFNGTSDYIEASDVSFGATDEDSDVISASAWVREDGDHTTTNTNQVGIVSKREEFFFGLADGLLTVGTYGDNIDNAASFDLPRDEWTHVYWVWDENNTKASIYVNSELRYTSSFSDTSNSSTSSLLVGALTTSGSNSPSAFFNGAISDVRIYDRALSASEVRSIYDQGLSVPESGMEGHFTMDSENYDSGTQTLTSVTPTDVTATYSSSLNPTTTGIIDGSFEFSNSVLETDGTIASKAPTSATFSAWVNIDTDATENQAVFAAFDGTTPGAVEVIVDADGTDNAGPQEIWYATTPDWTVNRTGAQIELGTWSMVTLAHDENFGTRIYRDGKLVDEKPSASPLSWTNANKIDIGQRTGGNASWPLEGKIDDAKVYNRPLSQSEVRRLYRFTAPYYKSEVDGTSKRNVSVRGGKELPYWTPAQLGDDLALWLDVWDSPFQTRTDADGNERVERWGDLSGNGNDAVQGAGSEQPILNSSLLFDGSDDHLITDISLFDGDDAPTSIAWLAKLESKASPNVSWGAEKKDGGEGFVDVFGTGDGKWQVNKEENSGALKNLTGGTEDTNWHVFVLTSSIQTNFWIDGVNVISGGLDVGEITINQLTIGALVERAGVFGNISAASYVGVDDVLTKEEREKQTGHLAHKADRNGIPEPLQNLPSDHPYKDEPPLMSDA